MPRTAQKLSVMGTALQEHCSLLGCCCFLDMVKESVDTEVMRNEDDHLLAVRGEIINTS